MAVQSSFEYRVEQQIANTLYPQYLKLYISDSHHYYYIYFGPMRNIESSFYKPFALPTQINNIGVLILAYVVHETYQTSGCTDTTHLHFLYFILYGSLIVYGFTLAFTILYALGIVDKCISKMTICGEVCLTINALGIFIFGAVYHVIAMIYGVYELLIETKSECVELEVFRKVNGLIYALWMTVGIFYLVYFFLWKRHNPNPPIDVLLEA